MTSSWVCGVRVWKEKKGGEGCGVTLNPLDYISWYDCVMKLFVTRMSDENIYCGISTAY